MDFIVIIDEEHSNNTAKAKDIIDHFSAKNIIRVSATAVENKRYEFYEIDELDGNPQHHVVLLGLPEVLSHTLHRVVWLVVGALAII